MKSLISILLIIFSINIFAMDQYKIELHYDEFSGECNGYLGGKIGDEYVGVTGALQQESKEKKLVSLGEENSQGGKQTFLINSEEGYFSFWLKDKFNDQDFEVDYESIVKSAPQIKVYKNDQLIENIAITEGSGLTCKVFTLDVEDGILEKEIKFYPKSRMIIGSIVNAITGEKLSNVDLTFETIGEDPISMKSSSNGMFITDVELGKYKIKCRKSGYIETEASVLMNIDEHPRQLVIAMSPEVRQYRIVLTWGAKPADLDAHLKGPHPRGGNFHISYQNRVLIEGKDFLDRDDRSKFGPETITIYKPAQGIYEYTVHNYTNRKSKRSKKLSRSNAVVQVYRENKLISTFNVPENQRGAVWRVFKIDEQQKLIPINKIDSVKI